MVIMALCFVAAFLGCCGILAMACLVEMATAKEEPMGELRSCVTMVLWESERSNGGPGQ